MLRIIAYAYESDVHCPDCAAANAAVGILRREPPLSLDVDEHGLAYGLTDREGNQIRPVLSTDEHGFALCADCGDDL